MPRPVRPKNTPSTNSPTDGSRAGSVCAVPIPRIVMRALNGLWFTLMVSAGVMIARSLALRMPASWMVSAHEATTTQPSAGNLWSPDSVGRIPDSRNDQRAAPETSLRRFSRPGTKIVTKSANRTQTANIVRA